MSVDYEVHPYAAKFPMLPEPELAELTESIARNGLRNPLALSKAGLLLLDGRNRLAACQRLGIDPETFVYEGDDLAEYVIDCNSTRRNQSTGARAMSTALVLQADGRRDGGRWRRGSVGDSHESVNNAAWRNRLLEAGVILDYLPDLATQVAAGDLALSAAFQQADELRRSEESEELSRRAQAKRERQEAEAAAARDKRVVEELTKIGSHYVALIDSGALTPAAAWAAHLQDTAKARKDQEDLEHGWRTTTTRLAEFVRYYDGGKEYGRIFVDDFYPHEATYVPDGMRLSHERIRACIEFLEAVDEGVAQ